MVIATLPVIRPCLLSRKTRAYQSPISLSRTHESFQDNVVGICGSGSDGSGSGGGGDISSNGGDSGGKGIGGGHGNNRLTSFGSQSYSSLGIQICLCN